MVHERHNAVVVCFLPSLPTEAQKKQLEESIELIQEECVSENADHSPEEPAEGGPDADGEEMTDGVEEDFEEDGGHSLVGTKRVVSMPRAQHQHVSSSFSLEERFTMQGWFLSSGHLFKAMSVQCFAQNISLLT